MRKSKARRGLALLVSFSLLVSLVTTFASAATVSETLGNVIRATTSGNTLTLTIDNGTGANPDLLTLDVCQNNILRVDYRPSSVEESPNTPIIDPNLTWDKVSATIDISGDPIIISSAGMRIEIARNPCRMTVKKADGTRLFWEPSNGGVYQGGVRFVRAEDSNMYGINGFDCFSDNGELLRNDTAGPAAAGQQGNSGGPFMWSTSGYGILIDSDGGYPSGFHHETTPEKKEEAQTNATEPKMEFYFGDTTAEGRRYEKDDVEYYIMLGNPKEIMTGYSKITGTSPMMPKWSLGFSNFEWNINETEFKQMVDLYRAKNIPIDGYAFDFDWKNYGDDNYGEFTWNTDNFPSAATTALKTEMDAKGIKMIGITKPRIVTKLQDGTPTAQGQYAENNDFFYPEHKDYTDYFLPVTVRSVDPYKEGARKWWWQHSEDAFDKGIVGWWNDEIDKYYTDGRDYWFGNFSTMGISQAMYEGQRTYTNDETRVWQVGRNYYPGTQRYATGLWSGDVATQFYKGERFSGAAGLNEQKAALLSTINNGQPKWGTDSGGFNQNSGSTENPSPELYTRWLQLASVVPVFRVHGTHYQQRQPWYFGTTAEETAKATIQQRYSLLPYMYNYEREAYETGLGLVRPLLFDYPNDSNVANYSDAWMFGDYLLVAPVTERGQSVKQIYLPDGNWIDYNRGTQYAGGQYISYDLNNESWTDLPMFVKQGGIIPTQAVQDYVGKAVVDKLKVDVFPASEETSFRYYDDDGKTYQYEDGAYFSQILSAKRTDTTTTIDVAGKTGSYDSGLDYYYLAVHGQAANTVVANGSNLDQCSDYNALLTTPGEGWTTGKDVYGKVTYVKVAASKTVSAVVSIKGDTSIQSSAQKYEAEYASLSGATVNTKAEIGNDHIGYSGTGFVDKLEADDAAVTFYAKVANAGDYDVDIRYANGDVTDKSLSVYVNGSYVSKANMTGTGNLDVWGNTVQTLPLAAGNNAITLKHDDSAGDTGFVNIDYIQVPFLPAAIKVEAESATLCGTAKTNQDQWFYSGSGFVDGLSSNGAGIEFPVEVSQSGRYSATFRFSNTTQEAKTLKLYINDAYVSEVLFSGTGGQNEWKNLTQTMTLASGRNIVALRYEAGSSGNISVDNLTVNVAGAHNTAPQFDNGGFERPTSFSSAWVEWHPAGQAVAYGIDSGSGSNPPDSPAEGDKRAYFYSGSAYQQSISQGVNVANGTYQVQAWVKVFDGNTADTSDANPSVSRMEVTGYGDKAIYVDMPALGAGWKLLTADVTVFTGYLKVGFYCNSPGNTVVHIDDVTLVRK